MLSNKWIKILCTIGPGSANPYVISRMEELGVDVLRINMSHTSIDQLDKMVKLIRSATATPICIDSEGAQIRTGQVKNGSMELVKNQFITLTARQVLGDENILTLTPESIFSQIEPGTLLAVDFAKVLFLVTKKDKNNDLIAKVLCPGKVGSNKAVNTDKAIELPGITPKDKQAVIYAKENNINMFALSFASNKQTVLELRKLVGQDATIISKVESLHGINNLRDIVEVSNAILIDRGDLSREVPIERLPELQKMIIDVAHQKPIPVYVATNLLESMILQPYPTRAEINDIANTLIDGANGLVLAAETAIGKYPIQCVSLVAKVIKQHLEHLESVAKFEKSWNGIDLLNNSVEPHGFNDRASDKNINLVKPIKHSNKLFVDESALTDIFNIKNGCYCPVDGFMNHEQLEYVLDLYRLPDGTVWTLPIILQAHQKDICFEVGEEISLVSKKRDCVFGKMTVSDIFKADKKSLALRWFGTDDLAHPGVKRLFDGGDYIIGGKVISSVVPDTVSPEYALTPSQVRTIFAHNGWDRVIGFHTRNIPHRAHEFIQMKTMEKYHADALFIHPAIGKKKPGDFTMEAILESYKAHVDCLDLKDRVLLSGFYVNSWYSGPREAVFTALCRKNYGCSHFILGRDHTGVGDFYKPGSVQDLFDKIGDIGIIPVFFDMIVYDTKKKHCVEVKNKDLKSHHEQFAGTIVRNAIVKEEKLPEWMVRPEVLESIFALKAQGKDIFVK